MLAFSETLPMETKDKKIKILEVAEELFANKGYSATSVREIAGAADVNVAMISYYFGSKESLLKEIFHFRSDFMQTQTDEVMGSKGMSNWEKLDFLIDQYVKKFSSNHWLHRIIVRESELNNNPDIAEFIHSRKKKHYDMITGFLKEGQRQGDFNKEADTLWTYTLLPAVIKFTLYNEAFLKTTLEERDGKVPDENELLENTKQHLKKLFRKILEIKE